MCVEELWDELLSLFIKYQTKQKTEKQNIIDRKKKKWGSEIYNTTKCYEMLYINRARLLGR